MGASSKKILGSPKEILEWADESPNKDQVLEKTMQLAVVDADFLEEGFECCGLQEMWP